MIDWIDIIEDGSIPHNIEFLLRDTGNNRRVIGIYKMIEPINEMGWAIDVDMWIFQGANDEEEIRHYQKKLNITGYAYIPDI